MSSPQMQSLAKMTRKNRGKGGGGPYRKAGEELSGLCCYDLTRTGAAAWFVEGGKKRNEKVN